MEKPPKRSRVSTDVPSSETDGFNKENNYLESLLESGSLDEGIYMFILESCKSVAIILEIKVDWH